MILIDMENPNNDCYACRIRSSCRSYNGDANAHCLIKGELPKDMTNGDVIESILDIDKDCVEVYGKDGKMSFTVTQDWWNAPYERSTDADRN